MNGRKQRIENDVPYIDFDFESLAGVFVRPVSTGGKMTIRAVFFDIGGVLLRMENHDKRHEWEARLGLPREYLTRLVFDSEIAARAMTGEVPEEAIWEHVARDVGAERRAVA